MASCWAASIVWRDSYEREGIWLRREIERLKTLAAFRENGWLKKLEGKGVSEQDIIAAVLEHNV